MNRLTAGLPGSRVLPKKSNVIIRSAFSFVQIDLATGARETVGEAREAACVMVFIDEVPCEIVGGVIGGDVDAGVVIREKILRKTCREARETSEKFLHIKQVFTRLMELVA